MFTVNQVARKMINNAVCICNYACPVRFLGIFVEKLQVADPRRFQTAVKDKTDQNNDRTYDKQPSFKNIKGDSHDYPENYKTCWDVFKVIKTAAISGI